jgi:putative DNA primase/helicase
MSSYQRVDNTALENFTDIKSRPNSSKIDISEDSLALEMGKRGWDEDARYVHARRRWLFWS